MRICRPLFMAALALTACGRARPSAWPASQHMQVRSCVRIPQATPGSEDIVVDRSGTIAFISSDPFRADKKRSGAIYAYHLDGDSAALAIDTTQIRFIRPHGMGLYTAADGAQRLFVVNHGRPGGDAIEIFRVNGARLQHDTTIQDTALVRGNDVVPVGPRSFYVTNSQISHTRPGGAWEILVTRGHSYVLYYDGARYSRVVRGLSFANGVNVSADGRRLYVTTSVGKDLRIYSRVADGSRPRRIRLGTVADNIDVDSTGGLWVASHLSAWAFFKYTTKLSGASPSEVLYFPSAGGEIGTPQRLVVDSLRPATSVAVRVGNRVLFGSVSDYALDCELVGGPPR